MRNQRKLIQLLQNNAQKDKPTLRVENVEQSPTIFLYGVIDEDWGVSARDIAQSLSELKGKAVTLRINSPGGDVFDGRAMYAAVRQHGNVTAQIDGVALSAASYVAMGAKSVRMIDGGFIMIHNAWTLGIGDKNDFIELADLLDKFDASIVNDYIKRTGKSLEEISAMMDAETWMDANEALELNFIDEVFDGDDEVEGASNSWNLSAYEHVPKALSEPASDESARWMQQRSMAERRLRLLDACSR